MSNFPIRHFLVMAHKLAVEPSLSNQSAQGTILCVEDNKAYLRVRKAVLEREGYSVLAASTRDEALRLFREAAVSLVLSDPHATRNNGRGTRPTIKSNQAACALRSLFGYGPRGHGQRGLLHQQGRN